MLVSNTIKTGFLVVASVVSSASSLKVMSPPAILKITKMDVKLGKLPEVAAIERQRVKILRAEHWPRTYLPAFSITGPQKVWVLSRYNSLGDIADDLTTIAANTALNKRLNELDAAEAPLLESKRDITSTFQPKISYRPDFDWTETRYWEIIWIHLRNGHHEAYEENRAMTREEHERGGFDTHQMMYAVQSGEMSGTFMVIRPMKTLALLDKLHAAGDGEPATEEEENKKVELYAESSLTEEEAFFRVDPAITYFPPD